MKSGLTMYDRDSSGELGELSSIIIARILPQWLENLADFFWVWDANQRCILYASPAYELIWGRPLQSLYEKPESYLESVHPDDAYWAADHGWKHTPTNPMSAVYRILRPDGSPRWVWERTYPIQDSESGVIHLIGLVQDITERKHAEETLLYRLAFEQMMAAIATRFLRVSAVETGREIEQALQTLGEFLGFDRLYLRELAFDGVTIADGYEWRSSELNFLPAERNGVSLEPFHWMMDRLHYGEIVYVPQVSNLPEAASRERAYWQTQGVQSVLLIPMTAGGELAGYIGFEATHRIPSWEVEDIQILKMVGAIFIQVLGRQQAEREETRALLREKQANRALRESEEKYRSLVENLRDVIFTTDERGCISYISPAIERLSGYRPVEVLGRPFTDFVDRRDLPDLIAQSGQLTSHEFRILTRQGEERWVVVSSTPITQLGNTTGQRGVMTDISDRKRSLQQI